MVMWQWLADRLTAELGHPKNGPLGWLVKRQLRRYNEYLARNAVYLSDIEPHHNVLEIGFGTGIGLQFACEKIQGGSGKVYGVEISEYMLKDTSGRLEKEIKENQLELTLTDGVKLPYLDNSMERVFHTNCYYFWPDVKEQATEIYRVMKPYSKMVTAFNPDRLKEVQDQGVLVKNVNTDPENYIRCLEQVGFVEIKKENLADKVTGLKFQAITAHVKDKRQ